MKKNIFLLLTTFTIITLSLLTGCSNPVIQEETTGKNSSGEVKFSWSQPGGNRGGLSRANTIQDARKVIITIEAADGTTVYSQKQLNLYNFNGSFISEPLSLKVGSYRLTDYLILNSAGTVIFATPKEGSAKAHLVADPLPINFTVTKDSTTKVIPEVIDVTEVPPADFGYATFSFTEAKVFNFLVSVMVYDLSTDSLVLTDAIMDVSSDAQSYSFNMARKTNNIAINDINNDYHLTIRKAGYEGYWASYTNAELKAFFQSPLVVVLSKKQVPVNTLITFADPGLEAAVRAAISKPAGDIYTNDVTGLTMLNTEGRNISNLSGVEQLTSLTTLDLKQNSIRDITPLSTMTNLTKLYLHNNSITDLTPLSTMTNLTVLYLDRNGITNISPLSALTNLTRLVINNNSITDITPLSTMISLTDLRIYNNEISDITPLVNHPGINNGAYVYLTGNPLNTDAQNVHIPALQARGVTVYF